MKPPTPEKVLDTLRQKCSAPRVVIDRAKFGAEFRTMRKRARISQNGMAKRLDVSGATLCYFEAGKRALTEDQQLAYIKECLKPINALV